MISEGDMVRIITKTKACDCTKCEYGHDRKNGTVFCDVLKYNVRNAKDDHCDLYEEKGASG